MVIVSHGGPVKIASLGTPESPVSSRLTQATRPTQDRHYRPPRSPHQRRQCPPHDTGNFWLKGLPLSHISFQWVKKNVYVATVTHGPRQAVESWDRAQGSGRPAMGIMVGCGSNKQGGGANRVHSHAQSDAN
jgi:hypothetical protein